MSDFWKLLPVVCWSGIYYSRVKSGKQLDTGYHFRVWKWKDEPLRLLTSACIHANYAHLTANCMTFLTTILSFRSPMNAGVIGEIVSALTVFYASHIGACVAVCIKSWMMKNTFLQSWAIAFPVCRVLSYFHDVKYQQRTFFCGASGGIWGLIGFVALTDPNPYSPLIWVTPCLREMITAFPWLVPQLHDSQRNQVEELSAVGHLGGFLVGFGLGLFTRYVLGRRFSPAPSVRKSFFSLSLFVAAFVALVLLTEKSYLLQ